MTKFKHDLLLRIVKILDAALITIPFALCWYLYYAERVYSPFYSKGNILVVALFFVAYITFGRIYDAFRMSMQRVSEVIYAQFLAAGASDLLMYVVIWLLTKHLPNILPGVAALTRQILLAVIWAFGANKWYFSTFPPQETAVIYDVRRDFAFKKKSPILPIIYETKRGIKIRNKNYSFFMYKQSKRTPFRV